jgi:hypothetical protein
LLTACSAFALSACAGGETKVEQRTVTQPTIDRAIANRLADRSDAVAALLESGDACGAAAAAARLRTEVTAAIGEIPEVYVEDLSGLVHEIQTQIPPCRQPAADEDEDGDDGDDGPGKGKKKGHKKKDD